MKKIKTYSIILGIALCAIFTSTSCERYSDNELYFIDNYDKELDEFNIIDTTSYRFIPLETTTESVFVEITKAIIDSNRIFIFDKDMVKKALIFNMNGEYIANIGNRGHGPGEYTSLRDMDIDKVNKRVILYDSESRKLMFYDYSGSFVKEIKIDSYPGVTFSCLTPERFVFFLSLPHETSSKRNQLLIYSDKGKLVDSYVPFIRKDCRFGNPNYFCRDANDIYFIPMYYDKIYKIGEDLKVEQVFDMQMDNIMVKDEDLKNNETGVLVKQDNVLPLDNVVLSNANNHFYCWTSYKSKIVGIYGDLNTKKVLVGESIFGELRMPTDAYSMYNDYFVGSFYPIEYKKNRFPDATIEDNQGILLFKFHDLNKYEKLN